MPSCQTYQSLGAACARCNAARRGNKVIDGHEAHSPAGTASACLSATLLAFAADPYSLEYAVHIGVWSTELAAGTSNRAASQQPRWLNVVGEMAWHPARLLSPSQMSCTASAWRCRQQLARLALPCLTATHNTANMSYCVDGLGPRGCL